MVPYDVLVVDRLLTACSVLDLFLCLVNELVALFSFGLG